MQFLARWSAWALAPRRAWVCAVWLAVAALAALATLRETTPFWPRGGLRIQTFDDQSKNGHSTVQVRKVGNEVDLSLRLDTGATWPVAGAIFHLASHGQGLDLSAPGVVRFEIGSSSLTTLQTCLVEEIPGFTRDDQWQTARYDCQELELVPGTSRYELPLDRFFTPPWWFATAGVRPSQLGPETRARVVRFVVQSGEGMALGVPGNVRFSSIAVVASHWGRSLLILVAGLLLSVLHFVAWRRARRPTVAEARHAVPFQPVEAVSYTDREKEAVVQYIATQYPDPELSLESISRGTGVPQDRITQHLKTASGLLFKAYLNRVRTEAASKLLRETDLPVSEIAGLVGYGNIPHFNRIFRELVGTTPSALREDGAALVESPSGHDKTDS